MTDTNLAPVKVSNDRISEIQTKSVSLVEQAEAVQIATQVDYETSASLAADVADWEKEVEKEFRPGIDSAHKLHKQLLDQLKKHLQPILKAKEILKGKNKVWLQYQEQLRREEEERLRKIQEEEARKEAERKAKLAEELGNTEKAEEIRESAENIQVEAPKLMPTHQKAAEQTLVKYWKARVTDLSKVPLEYLVPDTQKLNERARQKKGPSDIPGVEFYYEEELTQRTRR